MNAVPAPAAISAAAAKSSALVPVRARPPLPPCSGAGAGAAEGWELGAALGSPDGAGAVGAVTVSGAVAETAGEAD